jgi:hypothetical protein
MMTMMTMMIMDYDDDDDDANKIIQFFTIYALSQQLQGQLHK